MKAFPSSEPIYQDNVIGVKQSTGMDLRDYFASHAMQALISLPNIDFSHEECAKWAYRQADEMMKTREK